MPKILRQPSIYISHGGGPCFWMEFPPPIGAHGFDNLRSYLAWLLKSLPQIPKAILVISAHWEEKLPTVSTSLKPEMIFDYQGFPDHTYKLNYRAPGSPTLASQIQKLLTDADIENATKERGFDHGVFVPFLIIDPEATIPVVTLSLKHNLDPLEHIKIGLALEPLRDENILIVGSGSSYHNLREFFNGVGEISEKFDQWLNQIVTDPDITVRNTNLINWAQAPNARACHPREEHLLPLMVVAGSAGNNVGRCSFNDAIGGKWISCFEFS